MENASKALIIAGGILIGIIILSIFVYEMNYMGENARVYENEAYVRKIEEFNARFEKYTNREITAQDVVTLYNYIKEWNKDNPVTAKNTIKFQVTGEARTFESLIKLETKMIQYLANMEAYTDIDIKKEEGKYTSEYKKHFKDVQEWEGKFLAQVNDEYLLQGKDKYFRCTLEYEENEFAIRVRKVTISVWK